MKIDQVKFKAKRLVRDNSTSILAGLGISGVISTAVLASKASVEASKLLADADSDITRKEKFAAVWRLYIPTVASGALTIGCIVGGQRVGAKKTAAAYSLLTIAERGFEEYKEKVVETYGEKKEQAIRDAIAEDRVRDNPPAAGVMLVGEGEVPCLELHTGRYFHCDMETLRRAMNDVNALMIRENEASLNDFYYEVKLPYTSLSSQTGWKSDKLMKLEFSAVIHEGRPVMAFDYNYVTHL